jgi:hypothetical protein
MHQRQDAASNALGRIFTGVGEGERLFAAEAEPCDEASRHQPSDRWRERTEDREHPKYQ